jgi:hypothetical protein
MCGALARSETRPIFGWASDEKEILASVSAHSQCTNKGATDCKVVLSQCND